MYIPIVAIPIVLTLILVVLMCWPQESPDYFGLITIFRCLFLIPIGFIWAIYFGLLYAFS